MEKKGIIDIISVLIALLIIGVLGFFFYKNFIEIKEIANQNPFKANTNTNSTLEKDVEKLGFEKYNMMYSKTNYLNNTFVFFKDADVTIDNVSNQDKLNILYSFLSDEDKNKTGSYSDDCFLDKGIYTKDTYPSSCPKETFDKSILAEKLNNNFDNSMNVEYKDFYSSPSMQCFITGSTYNCYLNKSSFTMPNYTTFMKYDSASIEDNKLIVNSYLLTVRKIPGSNLEKGVYSNSSATNKIDDLPFEIGDTITQELTEKLVNMYKDKITKYKTTFIKSNSGYLWQKTEIVK